MVKKSKDRYDQEFIAWSDRMEKMLIKGIKALIGLLIVAQLALQFPAVRHWITKADSAEGVPFHRQSR
ncbi:hypothetical protein [Cohnella terricola]|uniref:Uncharacterized protein n=1 Tax=Cohnella terricola TaxID=1289167 RepID=A0A559JXC2_9BACL|nr:hypothetical protein [Cohnella terricola]TVY04545.1 hypothetical protein FPZ45_02925 [Cohnella terricola]